MRRVSAAACLVGVLVVLSAVGASGQGPGAPSESAGGAAADDPKLQSPEAQAELAARPNVPAVEKDGITFVAMRPLFEFLGASVTYGEGSVSAARGDVSCRLTVGSTQALVNGEVRELEQPPFERDGAVMIPLRFAGEALGAKVTYEVTELAGRISIAKPDTGAPLDPAELVRLVADPLADSSVLPIYMVAGRSEWAVGWLARYEELLAQRTALLEQASAVVDRTAENYIIGDNLDLDVDLSLGQSLLNQVHTADQHLLAAYHLAMRELPKAGEQARAIAAERLRKMAEGGSEFQLNVLREERDAWRALAERDPVKGVRTNAAAVLRLL